MTTFARLALVIQGKIKPCNWIERAFAAIGGSSLPSVTSADEGKVLTVDSSGEWVAEDASGCNCLAVTWTETQDYNTTTEETTTTRSSSATFDEIVYAMEHNVPTSAIYIYVSSEDGATISKDVFTSDLNINYTNGVASKISMVAMFGYHLEDDDNFHEDTID